MKNSHPDLSNQEYEAFLKKAKQKFQSRYDNRRISHFIPTLYMPYHLGSSKILVYFHANAEDIILAKELLEHMQCFLKVNILAVEYPGYGLYTEDI